MFTKSSYATCEICNKRIEQGGKIFNFSNRVCTVGEDCILKGSAYGYDRYICLECNEKTYAVIEAEIAKSQ